MKALFNNFGSAPVRIWKSARSTSIAQSFDRSRNHDTDTHSQVLTMDVLPIQPAPRVENQP
jgi:hypothetical protein